jgi:hypothetical protein
MVQVPVTLLRGYTSTLMPCFTGLSRRCLWVAEREGLPQHASNVNKINDLTLARSTHVYQCYALKSSQMDHPHD